MPQHRTRQHSPAESPDIEEEDTALAPDVLRRSAGPVGRAPTRQQASLEHSDTEEDAVPINVVERPPTRQQASAGPSDTEEDTQPTAVLRRSARPDGPPPTRHRSPTMHSVDEEEAATIPRSPKRLSRSSRTSSSSSTPDPAQSAETNVESLGALGRLKFPKHRALVTFRSKPLAYTSTRIADITELPMSSDRAPSSNGTKHHSRFIEELHSDSSDM